MTNFDELAKLYDEWIKEFEEKVYPTGDKEVMKINQEFMRQLRAIDRMKMEKSGSLTLSATVAFSSLAMLAGALIARYTLSFGERNNESLLKAFNEAVEKWYNKGLEHQEGKSLSKVPNLASNPPFY